ncbi:hypothetical protein BJ912DRAFT_1044220 [Pholiota molesta]|nr:hypothetical protein BJ912DRAFT_1044220 [Pholiota molesta]
MASVQTQPAPTDTIDAKPEENWDADFEFQDDPSRLLASKLSVGSRAETAEWDADEGLRIGLAERERQAMGGRWSKEVERNEYGAGGRCKRPICSHHHLPPLPPHAQISSLTITTALSAASPHPPIQPEPSIRIPRKTVLGMQPGAAAAIQYIFQPSSCTSPIARPASPNPPVPSSASPPSPGARKERLIQEWASCEIAWNTSLGVLPATPFAARALRPSQLCGLRARAGLDLDARRIIVWMSMGSWLCRSARGSCVRPRGSLGPSTGLFGPRVAGRCRGYDVGDARSITRTSLGSVQRGCALGDGGGKRKAGGCCGGGRSALDAPPPLARL